MKSTNALGWLVASVLLGPAVALGQPADAGRDRLLSTERWTAADTNDDDTLSAAELDRAEPSLSSFFDEIDTDGDRRIARAEIEAWRAGPEPGVVDADELPAGEVDAGDADAATQRTDDLLPDDGDKATELLPDDANDSAREPPAR